MVSTRGCSSVIISLQVPLSGVKFFLPTWQHVRRTVRVTQFGVSMAVSLAEADAKIVAESAEFERTYLWVPVPHGAAAGGECGPLVRGR